LSKDRILYINNYNKFYYKFDEIEIVVNTFDELYNIRDIFANATYKFHYSNSPKIVLDIGMNVGEAVVIFCTKNLEKIYGYEPFKGTFKLAGYNTRNCPKIKPYNCGIGESSRKKILL